MRNYKIKKTSRKFFGIEDITKEQKQLLKENKYRDYNQSGVLFIKYLGQYLELHVHTDRKFIMFCSTGEGCRPYTPAELDMKNIAKDIQINIKKEIKFLKEIEII